MEKSIEIPRARLNTVLTSPLCRSCPCHCCRLRCGRSFGAGCPGDAAVTSPPFELLLLPPLPFEEGGTLSLENERIGQGHTHLHHVCRSDVSLLRRCMAARLVRREFCRIGRRR